MKIAKVIMDTVRTRFGDIETPNHVIHEAAMNCLRNCRDLHCGSKDTKNKIRHYVAETENSDYSYDSKKSNEKSVVSDSQGSTEILSEWNYFCNIEKNKV